MVVQIFFALSASFTAAAAPVRLLPQLQQVLLDGLRAEPRQERGAEQRGAGSRIHRTMEIGQPDNLNKSCY